MEWVFLFILSFFGFGIGRSIKLHYLERNFKDYMSNLKFPFLGLSITFFVGGLLYRAGWLQAPADNWVTWLILWGPFVLALFGSSEQLRAGENRDANDSNNEA